MDSRREGGSLLQVMGLFLAGQMIIYFGKIKYFDLFLPLLFLMIGRKTVNNASKSYD
jgi:hypothetical protein